MNYFTDICFRGPKEEIEKIYNILNVENWSRAINARRIIDSILKT